MDVSDCDLMKGIAAGDGAAFDTFYTRHQLYVLRVLLRLLQEPADAEDVMQETFLQIWHRSGQYDPSRATPAGYLTLVARSRALDLIRRRRATQPEGGVEPTFEFDPTLGLVQDESRTQMRDAMAKLPVDQRQVIRMAFLASMTHEQIAGQLNLPLGTVKTRIRLGLQRLKSILPEAASGGGLTPADLTLTVTITLV